VRFLVPIFLPFLNSLAGRKVPPGCLLEPARLKGDSLAQWHTTHPGSGVLNTRSTDPVSSETRHTSKRTTGEAKASL